MNPVDWILMNADPIIRGELYLELGIAVFCFIINVYFAFRFARISTFDPSLRLIMVCLILIRKMC